MKNKNFYIAVVINQDGRYIAYNLKVNNGNNLLSALKIKNLYSATICSTKREMEELIEFWNQCYIKNGTHLFYNIDGTMRRDIY